MFYTIAFRPQPKYGRGASSGDVFSSHESVSTDKWQTAIVSCGSNAFGQLFQEGMTYEGDIQLTVLLLRVCIVINPCDDVVCVYGVSSAVLDSACGR